MNTTPMPAVRATYRPRHARPTRLGIRLRQLCRMLADNLQPIGLVLAGALMAFSISALVSADDSGRLPQAPAWDAPATTQPSPEHEAAGGELAGPRRVHIPAPAAKPKAPRPAPAPAPAPTTPVLQPSPTPPPVPSPPAEMPQPEPPATSITIVPLELLP